MYNRYSAIDFVHSLNIGGRNALDWTECPQPWLLEQVVDIEPDVPMKTHICPVKDCKHNFEGFCTNVTCHEYHLYRHETGRCETCGHQMANHPVCDGCDALCGVGHLDALLTPIWVCIFRTYKLCGHCLTAWKVLNVLLGRKATWQEFHNPQPKMFREREEEYAGDKGITVK